MSALLLYVLAITDWAFAGYRHAAGRDGRIFKGAYYRRSVAVALALGHGPIGFAALLVFGLVAVDAIAWQTMLEAARPMIVIYGAFATLVLSAFVPYLFGNTELRTLATVTIFGPLTLLRPLVIVVGAVAAVVAVQAWPVVLAATAAALANVTAEWLLGRLYPLPRA